MDVLGVPRLGTHWGLAVLVATAGGLAQRARITNLSPAPQFGWVDIAIPQRDDTPAVQVFGDRNWPVVRGRELGDHSTMLHVWAAGLRGGESLSGEFRATDGLIPPFAIATAIGTVADLMPQPVFRCDGQTHRPVVDVLRRVDHNASRQVWHLRSQPVDGLIFEAWIDLRNTQWAVGIEYSITWSDRDDPDWAKSVQAIWLETKHELLIDFAPQLGVRTEARQPGWITHLMGSGQLGDGEQLKYRGTLLCRPDTDEQAGSDRFAERRQANLEARRDGPIRGVCLDWDGHWLAFGLTPEVPTRPKTSADARHRSFRHQITRPGKMFDQRPLAGTKRTAQTGGQRDFGCSKDGMLLHLGDPRLLWELEHSDAYYFRGFHHRERDGNRLRKANHPGWFTWAMYSDHRNSTDMLGKAAAARPWALRHGISHWGGADDQHRSQNYELALLALSGSFMLESCFLDCLETDLAQVRGRAGAPRATGRLMLTWAGLSRLLALPDRDRLLAHAERRLAAVEAQWLGRRFVDDPQQAVRVFAAPKDARVIEGVRAWMPWQESLATIGLFAMWKVTDEPRYRDLACAIAETVTRFGVFADSKGHWHCCTGVRYRGGKPLPAEAYRLGSPDLRISNSFWTWTLPAVLICRELTADPTTRQRAETIIAAVAGRGPNTWATAEWWACARLYPE